MSLRAMVWAFDQNVPANEKMVLLALADWARDDGLCWPGQAAIAGKAKVSVRTVRTIMDRLETKGFLTREIRSGDGSGRKPDLVRLAMAGGQPANVAGRASGNTPASGQPAKEGRAYMGLQPSSTATSQSRLSISDEIRKPVTYNNRRVPREVVDNAENLLAVFNEQTGRKLQPRRRDGVVSDYVRQIIGALLNRSEVPPEAWARAIRNTVANPPGWAADRELQIGDVFGSRSADHALANTGKTSTNGNGNGHGYDQDAAFEAIERMARR